MTGNDGLRESGGRGEKDTGPCEKLRAGSLTPLGFAQNDKPLGDMRTEEGSAIAPFAMELREAAIRMTHLYWYWSVCPFADESSSNRMASLLYVDTN